jgi:hypothetical protein
VKKLYGWSGQFIVGSLITVEWKNSDQVEFSILGN